MEIITNKKRLKELGKMAYDIRHIVFKKSIPKLDVLYDKEHKIDSDDVVGFVKDALKKNTINTSSGAFKFEKTKSGDVRMIPNFSFLIKIERE